MKILYKLVAVIFALILELVVLQIVSNMFYYGHGPIADTRYRQKERLAAYYDHLEHPSQETNARFQEELRLMHKHEDWKSYLVLGVFSAVNGVWIYFYFRGRRRPNTALEPTPTAP